MIRTISISGGEYGYPDLEKAWKVGLEKVRSGKAEININYSKNDGKRDNTVFHVSDLGYAYGKCERQLWYKLHQAEKEEPHYGIKMLFTFGDIIHIIAPQLFEIGLPNYWTISHVEKPVNDGLPGEMVGRCDIIIRGKQGEKIIVDCKTSRGNNFRYLDDDGTYEENKAQVRGYIFAEHADYGIVFHIDREGQNGVRQFPVEADNQQFLNDLYKIKQLVKEKPSKMLPQLNIRENKVADNSIKLQMPWQCSRCDYLDVSCKGALPPEQRGISGIVARERDDGSIYPDKEKYKGLLDVIKKTKEVS